MEHLPLIHTEALLARLENNAGPYLRSEHHL